MKIEKIKAVCFSPTGNARKIAETAGEQMAQVTGAPWSLYDITLPQNRTEVLQMGKGEHLILAVPVYAGRIPNKLLPWIQEGFKSDGATATAIVSFGNRNCDSALGELKQELENNGFQVVSAAAIVSEHAFSDQLAGGRPDADDLDAIRTFAEKTCAVLDRQDGLDLGARAEVAPYYVPRRLDGEPAKFLKAKPVTDPDLCKGCGICASVCSMGSIDREDPKNVPGICIKCQACIKKCPQGAKSIVDEDFLSHRAMLIANFTRRAENEFYL